MWMYIWVYVNRYRAFNRDDKKTNSKPQFEIKIYYFIIRSEQFQMQN